MAKKKYDAQPAKDPGTEIDYRKFVDDLPEEFRAEIEEALAALLSYIHSDEGTSVILDNIQKAKGNEPAQIGISSLQAMDAADEGHQWSDSAKVFCGYFAVKEVATIAKEAGIIDLPPDKQEAIYKQAAQNYMHALIKNKPTPEEREAEAIRLQKEVEPIMDKKSRAQGYAAAKEFGVPHSDQPEEGEQESKGGLLE